MQTVIKIVLSKFMIDDLLMIDYQGKGVRI